MQALSLVDLQSFENDPDPHIQDLRLAEGVGYVDPFQIRTFIKRNLLEIERRFGIVFTVKTIPDGAGRPGTEFWLNERQALWCAAKSETEFAGDILQQIIDVFYEWRRGRLAPTRPGNAVEALELFFTDYKETKKEVGHLKACVNDLGTRVGRLEDYRSSGRQRDRCELSPSVKAQHVEATHLLGGRCPCCSIIQIVDAEEVKVEGAEFDHFNNRTDARLEATWLICFDCNRRDLGKAYSKDRRDMPSTSISNV